MVDREKVLAVLKKRFAGASDEQMAAAANAIVGLADEWEEVQEGDAGFPAAPDMDGIQFRVLRRAIPA
jgi:hypothetical protein